jgi:hypothetical protein
MDFITTPVTKHVKVDITAYFDGHCFSCGSYDTAIRSSYTREVTDLGSPIERRIIDLKVALIECNSCGFTFTPVSREYPAKYEYSLAVITYALARYFRDNASANEVARELATLHGVDVPADTIYTWNRQLSEDFASAMTSPAPVATVGEEAGQASSTPDPASSGEASDGKQGSGLGGITTISVDGTFVTTGVDVVGKKKRAGSSSATKKKDKI